MTKFLEPAALGRGVRFVHNDNVLTFVGWVGRVKRDGFGSYGLARVANDAGEIETLNIAWRVPVLSN